MKEKNQYKITVPSIISLVFSLLIPLIGIILSSYLIITMARTSANKRMDYVLPSISLFVGLVLWIF